jgi:hypothetical protein
MAWRQIRTCRYPSDYYTVTDRVKHQQPATSIQVDTSQRTSLGRHSALDQQWHQTRYGLKRETPAPLDIMLKLPSSALNSISCARGTMLDAAMFCTASTIHHTRQWININARIILQDRHQEMLTSCVKRHANLCNNAASTSSATSSRAIIHKERLIVEDISGMIENPYQDIRTVVQHLAARGYARRQAAFRIGCLALVDLRLLCSVKLHLELVAQYIQPALRLQTTNINE